MQLSIRKKLLFSVISTLAAFALLELLLVFVGVNPVTSLEDPFVGFSQQVPLMEASKDADGQEIMSTAKSKLTWFNAQSFPKKKPANTYRIFCLGGSTTYGHPYWDPTSYSRWLREFLPVIDPSQKFEVINAGGISYASYRVANVLEELSKYEPDLFIVYSVHNEFLERRTYAELFDESPISFQIRSALSKTKTWALLDELLRPRRSNTKPESDSKRKTETLPAEVDEILNHTIGPIDYHRDPEWQAKVLNHYTFNLKRMVAIARQNKAKIVFLTPASNEKNCSPFKSESPVDLSEVDQKRLNSLLSQAVSESSDDHSEKALQLLHEALTIDEHYAQTYYQIGRSQMSLQRYDEAKAAFRRALNEDVCPLRAVDGISNTVRQIATQEKVPIVDFEGHLRALCQKQQGHAVFGDEYFMDHVHPSIEVHQQLARWIIQVLQEYRYVEGKSLNDTAVVDEIAKIVEKVDGEIDTQAYGIALRNLAKVLHWAGKFEEAGPHARDALVLLPDDPESRFVLADSLKNMGRSEEAIYEYDRLFENDFDFDRAYHQFGYLLAKEGQLVRAKAYLILAAVREPENASIQYSLGIVHLQLGEYAFAIESLTESDRQYPNDASTLFFLAQAKAGNKEPDEAIALFEKVLALGYEPAKVHFGLGMLYLEKGEKAKAIENFESALQCDPTFEEARKYLLIAK